MSGFLPFDSDESKRRKDAGMEQVLSNAPQFKDKVRAVIRYLARHESLFTGDDVRQLSTEWGIDEPHHPNAWGAAMSAAAKAGDIVRVTHRKSIAVSRHAGMQGVWRSAK